jgi:hypothetical protein
MMRSDIELASELKVSQNGFDLIPFVPVLAALSLPFLLMLFHVLVDSPSSLPRWLNIVDAVFALLCVFAIPVVGFVVACRPGIAANMRRLAYATVAAPTLFVFLGVVQRMIKSPVPDEWAWCILWPGATLCALYADRRSRQIQLPGNSRWRIAHGLSAAVVVIYVLFHIANHLAGLLGPVAHREIMDIGRSVYRAREIEPVLVVLFLFQAATGLYLAWGWSASPHDPFRAFQVASGVYLSVFILGHMNSVFLYARTYLGIQTDWSFATGAPTGLIHDAWNIRLLPHYALGVFLVLGHLLSGLRVVCIAHGAELRLANRLWLAGLVVSGIVAAAIIAGMCGVRV